MSYRFQLYINFGYMTCSLRLPLSILDMRRADDDDDDDGGAVAWSPKIN